MQRLLFMLVLIVAGEMIFSLPFHTTRFFRPTLLEAFSFSNTQLGDVFAVYGIMAMISYFPGGAIADRFSARALMAFSLLATSAGGVYMATFPGPTGMAILFGYWGVTTIFLFWAALIKATREWGGQRSQGKAFGILEGGRGLVAAAFAVLAVSVFSLYLPATAEHMSDFERLKAFRMVILLYSAGRALSGGLVWMFLPIGSAVSVSTGTRALSSMGKVMQRPVVWAQAAIIICAYCGYKGLDNYALYAVQVLGMNEVEAAKFTAYATYLRPVAAVTAGLVADRSSASKLIMVTFGVLLGAYGVLAWANTVSGALNLMFANILVSYFAVFALRGVYFALLQETRMPGHITGTSVGMISFVGYTPEIFFGPITGRILDHAPGLAGHQHYFRFLALVSLLGVFCVVWLLFLNRPARETRHTPEIPSTH